MDAIECINTRRSVRKFLTIPVEWDKLTEILDCARLAPSAGNIQDRKFIIAVDADLKAKIAEACLEQEWLKDAPVLVVVCAEPKKVERFYGVRGEEVYSVQNSAASVENMLLAAHALGLGACWAGAFDDEMLKRTLSIPDAAVPQAVVAIGYPDESPAEPVRHGLESMVYFERWGNKVKHIAEMTGEYSEYVRKALKKLKSLIKR